MCSDSNDRRAEAEVGTRRLIELAGVRRRGAADVLDWLRSEYAVGKSSRALTDPAGLTADALVAEVRKLRGKKHPLSVAGLKALKDEHFTSVLLLQALAAEAEALEQRASDAVNAAFGLTPDEVALLWATAPRTPLAKSSD